MVECSTKEHLCYKNPADILIIKPQSFGNGTVINTENMFRNLYASHEFEPWSGQTWGA